MAKKFYKENGNRIDALISPTGTIVVKSDDDGVYHELTLTTKLKNIKIDNTGTLQLDNTIFIDEHIGATKFFKDDVPEVYFTAIDTSEIFLNIKIKVDATKTNHAGFSFVDRKNS
jgi:hypothetical protein